MNLPVQHLSDEAVAAFADGALGNGARNRAARHIAQCPECARAVAVQREAVWALRAAPAPPLPCGLLDRLRAVPSTTPLNQQPLAVDESGSAAFPAFGTAAVVEPGAPVREADQASTVRRSRPYGLLTAAAAVLAIGAVSGAVAATSHSGAGTPAAPGPAAPAHVRPAVGPSVDMYLQPVAGTSEFARSSR